MVLAFFSCLPPGLYPGVFNLKTKNPGYGPGLKRAPGELEPGCRTTNGTISPFLG